MAGRKQEQEKHTIIHTEADRAMQGRQKQSNKQSNNWLHRQTGIAGQAEKINHLKKNHV